MRWTRRGAQMLLHGKRQTIPAHLKGSDLHFSLTLRQNQIDFPSNSSFEGYHQP
jgi:hypothetical protein